MKLQKEPYNFIVTGVGGQGNVFFSQLIGEALVDKGYFVTIGETYGASQRGGSVMSHMRISKKKQRSPLIAKGQADIVTGLEPIEALRVLAAYGNPNTVSLVNTRPIYPVDVTAGDETYPELEEIRKSINELTACAYYIDATGRALQIGSAILANMIMIGALLELKLLPLGFQEFRETLSKKYSGKSFESNLKAFEEGRNVMKCLF